jgi:hypothetical protein
MPVVLRNTLLSVFPPKAQLTPEEGQPEENASEYHTDMSRGSSCPLIGCPRANHLKALIDKQRSLGGQYGLFIELLTDTITNMKGTGSFSFDLSGPVFTAL